jgi:hypothetical protein
MKRTYIFILLIVSCIAASAQTGQTDFKVSTIFGNYTVVDAVPMPATRIGTTPHNYKGMKVSLSAALADIAGDRCAKPLYDAEKREDADHYLQEGSGISAKQLGIKVKAITTVKVNCDEEPKLKYADSMGFECELIWDGTTLFVYHDMQILKLKRSN